MAQLLSNEDRELFFEYTKKAEPYAMDDPIIYCLDGEHDSARMMATIAKKLLEDDDKLRKELNGNIN